MNLNSKGFTVVEVVITLIIATLLLTGVYQAYSVVTATSRDSRNLAEASDIVYATLRQRAASITGDCYAISQVNVPISASSSLPQPRALKYSVSCPYAAVPNSTNKVSLVSVTATYGSPAETVSHAIYVYP